MYEDKANPQRFHIVDTTEDERFAILTISERGKGKDGNAVFVRDLSKGEKSFTPVLPEIGDDTFNVLDNVGDKLLIETNHNAPNERRRPRRSAAAGGGELEDDPAGEAGTAAGRRHSRREAVRNVPQGRHDQGLCLQRRRQARKRNRSCPGRAVASGFGGNHDDARSSSTRSTR